MTKHLLSVLAGAAILAAFTPLSITTSAAELNCRVPFDFVANGAAMPAGQYALSTTGGGAIREIAGNDEIMVSLIVRAGDTAAIQHGTVIFRMTRDGIPGERVLVNVRMRDLAAFLNAYPRGEPGLEHVFDY